MKKLIILLMLTGFALPVVADSSRSKLQTIPRDPLLNTIPNKLPERKSKIGESFAPDAVKIAETPSFTLEQLQQQPQLLEQLLNEAMVLRRYDIVAQLLPLYRQQEQADPILIDFAQGALYRVEGKHSKAIRLYQKMLAAHPDHLVVRLDLGAMLFENMQTRDAEQLFTTILAEVPENIKPRIMDYIAAIKARDTWAFSAGLNYAADKNVNNMSAKKTIMLDLFGAPLEFDKKAENLPQSAHGFEYNLSATKDYNIKSNHYVSTGLDIYGVSYWDNHAYDDLTASVRLGYLYKNINSQLSVVPYYAKRRYANTPYYDRYGVNVNASRWLGNQWRVAATTGLSRKSFVDRINHSYEWQLGTGLTYILNHKTYFLLGLNSSRDKMHHNPSATSRRVGAYIGWGQTWPWAIASRVIFNRYNEKFEGGHFVFQKQKRYDKYYIPTLTVWHRDIAIWGITPKLNINHKRVKSNINDLHSYRKNKIYLSFEKDF